MSLYFHASKLCQLAWNKGTLNHIVDRGQRALASCLGGGDLDGDIFNLILDVSSKFLVHSFMLEHSAAETATSETPRTRRIHESAKQNDTKEVWHLRCRGLRI